MGKPTNIDVALILIPSLGLHSREPSAAVKALRIDGRFSELVAEKKAKSAQEQKRKAAPCAQKREWREVAPPQ